jgi:hypothetical protein
MNLAEGKRVPAGSSALVRRILMAGNIHQYKLRADAAVGICFQ